MTSPQQINTNDPIGLFLFELGGVYDAEKKIAQMLPMLADEVEDDRMRQGFQEHARETQQHIRNLEQVFRIMGTEPPQVTCHAVDGLRQDHDTFIRQNPPKSVVTMFDAGAAARTEHYEIASYRGLTEKAQLLGQQDVERLLQENLRQEEAMAHRVEQIGRELGQRQLQGARP